MIIDTLFELSNQVYCSRLTGKVTNDYQEDVKCGIGY